MDFFSFKPIYKQRVWGGRELETHLKRNLPEDVPIGESWELVDREQDESLVDRGEWAGFSIRELLLSQGHKIMGPKWPNNKRFPILVKWLDCKERLSLQVHPPHFAAEKLGGEPKTENWYVVKTEPNATLVVGVKEGVSKEAFKKAIEDQTLENCVHTLPVQRGDAMFIPSGRLHAIGAGNFILEIQQNSDTTYRVYDWGRVGLNGKPRQLHVNESLESMDFSDHRPEILHTQKDDDITIADCDAFRIRKYVLKEPLKIEAGEQPRLISVVEGGLNITSLSVDGSNTLPLGSNILLPYEGSFNLAPEKESCTLIITDRFV